MSLAIFPHLVAFYNTQCHVRPILKAGSARRYTFLHCGLDTTETVFKHRTVFVLFSLKLRKSGLIYILFLQNVSYAQTHLNSYDTHIAM